MISIDQAVAQWVEVAPPTPYSCFLTDVDAGPDSDRSHRGEWRHNLTTTTASGYTNAYDWMSKLMGQGPSSAFATAQGTATATTATSLTNSGASFPTSGQGLAGCIVFAGANSSGVGSTVYGVISSNTATALTIDQWYSGTSSSGAAGTTPNATCQYLVFQGQAAAAWMAVTATSFSPATSDTTLNGELTSNGFTRAVGTYSHTAAASTYSLAHTWTATGSETIENEALFGAANTTAGGVMPFESAEPTPPSLLSGDTLTNTVTITL